MRLKSLNSDKNDEKLFRDMGDKNFGMTVYNEHYEHLPMFFSKFGAEINLVGQYNGGSIFFICNGPSFAKLDHNKLRLPGVMTYGINNGPKTFRPNFWTCVDDPARFLRSIWTDPKITKIVPFSFADKAIFDGEKWQMMDKKVGDCPNVIYFRRNEKFNAERWLWEPLVNWGNHRDHGGGRSVMLATLRLCFLLGFRKVYLLGCDLNMTENYTYHFDEQRTKGAVNCNMGTYERLKNEYFPSLRPHFDAAGFQVFNCNPDSALKCFPFISFDEAIKEATSPLGDVENERTWGMYSKPEEKDQWKNEPNEQKKNHLASIRNGQQKNDHMSTTSTLSRSNQSAPATPIISKVMPQNKPEVMNAEEIPVVMPNPRPPIIQSSPNIVQNIQRTENIVNIDREDIIERPTENKIIKPVIKTEPVIIPEKKELRSGFVPRKVVKCG